MDSRCAGVVDLYLVLHESLLNCEPSSLRTGTQNRHTKVHAVGNRRQRAQVPVVESGRGMIEGRLADQNRRMRHSGPLPECGRGCAHGSNRSTALNNVDQDDRECDYQENMNETTECVGRYDSQQPENQQNHKDCPEHLYSFRRSMPLPSLMQFGGLLSVATSPSLIRCPRLSRVKYFNPAAAAGSSSCSRPW